MSLIAIALLVVSAIAHAWWNLCSKRGVPSASFFLIANLAVGVIQIPFLVYYRHAIAEMGMGLWVLLGVTGIFEAVYYLALAKAYQRGDMSVVYPLTRALPVILVPLGGALLGQGGPIGPVALGGMVLITLGCFLLPLKRFGEFDIRHYLHLSCIFGFICALSTVGYTLVDDGLIKSLRGLGAQGLSALDATLLLMLLLNVSSTLFLGLYIALDRGEHASMGRVWREARALAVGTGLVIWFAYGLVLASMLYVRDVSYVAAFRQLSIPIGAVLAMSVLKEPRHRPRVWGVVVIAAGLALVAMG